MSDPQSSPLRQTRTLKIWIGLLLIALVVACGVIYRQYQQAQVAACATELVEMRDDLVKFKQSRGSYPATWRELSNFTGTQIGYCRQSETQYALHPNADGSVSISCDIHHTFTGTLP